MAEGDPVKIMVLKIALTVISAFGIIFFLKPLLVIAASLFVCSSCDATVMILSTAVLFGAAVMVPIYKTIGVFFQ